MTQSHKFTSILLLLCFVLLLGNSNSCGPVEEPLDHATAQQIEKIITDEMIAQEMIGTAVGIVKNGKIAFLKGYGYKDWEARTPVTLSTEFRWASMSKSLTAVVAMKLRENGKLDLNASAKSYIGAYPHESVKVAQLLQNRSGVGHYAQMDSAYAEWQDKEKNYPKNQAWNAAKAVDIFKESPLMFTPGAKYHYSTFGFILAGAVVENAGMQAYNKGYVQLVNDYIAQPLGMSTLKPDYVFGASSAEVIGYYKDDDGDIQRRDDDDVTWKLPGGGFKSTITDVTRFVKGLANRQMLHDSTYELMWTKQADSNYSYGFGIEENGSNRRVAPSGSQTKTATYYVVVPKSKLGVAVMCNSEWARPVILGKKILQALGVALSPGEYAWNCNAEDKSDYQYAGVWRKGNRDQVIRKGY
ncbi:class A beta-lactamase-related serine hydrolase, partial [candidate division KSB1 bacterium]|nr:class A beta-lactamase-related serine hydrolase [candidate division KSB1 bacterium]